MRDRQCVAIGVYSDRFIHAGNIANLSLISLFPFFILTAALAQTLGRGRLEEAGHAYR